VRRRTIGVVALVVVLATTGVVVVLTRSAGAGPFASPGEYYNRFGEPAKTGQIVAAYWVLPRTLSKPVVLLDVHPLHPEDARGVVLRYGAIDVPTIQYQGRIGWNPKAWHMRPLAGFVLTAHHRGTLGIGASSRQAGVHPIRNFVLDYRIGGTTYSAPQQVDISLCTGYRTCP
jgi:hypothetical protein